MSGQVDSQLYGRFTVGYLNFPAAQTKQSSRVPPSQVKQSSFHYWQKTSSVASLSYYPSLHAQALTIPVIVALESEQEVHKFAAVPLQVRQEG